MAEAEPQGPYQGPNLYSFSPVAIPVPSVTPCPVHLEPACVRDSLYSPWRCLKDSGKGKLPSWATCIDLHLLQPYFWGEQGDYVRLTFLERELFLIHPLKAIAIPQLASL